MMMSDNKKKTATIIISKMNGKPEEMEEKPKNEHGDEMDSEAGYLAAAEDMMQAMHSKDAKAFKNALKAFVNMCSDEEGSED